MNCPACGKSIEPGARFCSGCGRPATIPMYAPTPSQFVRPREGRMIAGVCAGIAMRYGWDVAVVRLVTALFILFAGVPLLAYIIAWIVMPNAQFELPSTTGIPAS
jgi:phage shock protein C